MSSIRRHLTYANVASSLFVFLVLGGATAFAATQLGKNSVGTKQLKKNSVTAAKIKKNAVTKAKIKSNAVNSAKIADGAVTGTDIDLASTPFSHVVARLRGTATVSIPGEEFVVYSLANPTYTQGVEELNSYVGALNLSFSPSCVAPRSATGYIFADVANPSKPTVAEIVAAGSVKDPTGANPNQRIELGPYIFQGAKFEPAVATNHSLSLGVSVECASGAGAAVANGAVDVIGTK